MPAIEIHTTDRASFKRCRQRWDFSSNIRQNLETIKPITPLWFGIGMHEALGAYYHPSQTQRSYSVAADALTRYVNEWIESIESPTEDNVEWANFQEQLGLGMLDYYCNVYAPPKDEELGMEVLWVEKEFIVEVPGMPGVTYSFRVDGLVRDKDGRIWILEHKTAAQLYEDEEWLSLDDQCGSYLWGLTQLPEPIYAEGVIYNTLRKAVPHAPYWLKSGRYSMNKQASTTYLLALKTFREHYGKVPKMYWDYLDFLKYQPDKFCKRTPVRRNRRELAALGESLRYEVLDMVNDPFIYRSASRINCQGCPFIAPCQVKWEGGDEHFLLNTAYRPREGGRSSLLLKTT